MCENLPVNSLAVLCWCKVCDTQVLMFPSLGCSELFALPAGWNYFRCEMPAATFLLSYLTYRSSIRLSLSAKCHGCAWQVPLCLQGTHLWDPLFTSSDHSPNISTLKTLGRCALTPREEGSHLVAGRFIAMRLCSLSLHLPNPLSWTLG